MTPLQPPDSFHLSAAEGWLGLGNHLEANEELERIKPQLRVHPDVLKVRWQIYAKAGHWQTAVEIATAGVRLAPQNSEAWLQRSFALHELKRTTAARDLLLPAADKFPKHAPLRYNLACYECQLGNLAQAKEWLEEAFTLDQSKELKLEALSDANLEPLWKHIGEL